MRTLIIDDELSTHQNLKLLLKKNHPEVEVLASAFKLKEAYDLIKLHQPDLIFLDIELPDGQGFELLNKFLYIDFQVIYISGKAEYAVRAVEEDALFYLVKPFARNKLALALKKAAALIRSATDADRKPTLEKSPSRIPIHTVDRVFYTEVSSIMWLQAQGRYTNFHLKELQGVRIIKSAKNLGHYAQICAEYQALMQVHRSYIIQLYQVREVLNAGYVVMKNDKILPVSQQRLSILHARMKVLE